MAKAIKPVDTTAVNNPANPVMSDKNKKAEIAEIAKNLGVNKVYENSCGEYFTTLNLAVLSEGGKGECVTTHMMEDEGVATGTTAGEATTAGAERVAR